MTTIILMNKLSGHLIIGTKYMLDPNQLSQSKTAVLEMLSDRGIYMEIIICFIVLTVICL